MLTDGLAPGQAYLKPYVDDEGANEALVATLDEVCHRPRPQACDYLAGSVILPRSSRPLRIVLLGMQLQCDFKSLCEKVDNLYRTWRGETLVLFGGADRYIDQKTAFDFLETKRTSIKIKTFEARVR